MLEFKTKKELEDAHNGILLLFCVCMGAAVIFFIFNLAVGVFFGFMTILFATQLDYVRMRLWLIRKFGE